MSTKQKYKIYNRKRKKWETAKDAEILPDRFVNGFYECHYTLRNGEHGIAKNDDWEEVSSVNAYILLLCALVFVALALMHFG